MPVVSDASPLILFANIHKLELLRKLYSEILIPPEVEEELTRQEVPLITLAIKEGWVKVKKIELFPEVRQIGEKLKLHRGEIYALSLALHTDIKWFLVDDKLARIAAKILGLKVIGCLGVIMKAYETGSMEKNEAFETIRKLVQSGLWLSPEVLGEALAFIEHKR